MVGRVEDERLHLAILRRNPYIIARHLLDSIKCRFESEEGERWGSTPEKGCSKMF